MHENRPLAHTGGDAQAALTLLAIEGLHDAARNYARTNFKISWFPYCTARYGEKEQKTLELSIYFMEGFEISSECVC